MKKIIITESQFEMLKEANRIRRLRDDEYPSFQVDTKNLEMLKKNQPDAYKDVLKAIGNNDTNKEVEKVKDNINKDLHQRLKDNGEDLYVDTNSIEIGNVALRKLENNGIKIGLYGQVFSYGNTKLPPSTMIINLTSAFNCPAKHCPLRQSVCYAFKNERQYGFPELRNLRNEFTLEKLTVKEILQLLDVYIMNAPIRINQIRLSENGDFKSQEIVDFCETMARHLEAKYGIKTTCYTHQPFDFTNCKSMIVNSSMRGERIVGADRNYLVVSEDAFNRIKDGLKYDEKRKEMTFKCHCDCYKCNFCYNTKEENGEDPNMRTNVYCKQH